ncbi:MAG TPA: hypothetical protein VGI58_17000 [Streptosporangiaceae bacterium]
MPGHILLAAVSPANTPHGYNWTFGFPMILFLVIAAGIYVLLFARPHQRVPARRINLPSVVPPPRSPEPPSTGNNVKDSE